MAFGTRVLKRWALGPLLLHNQKGRPKPPGEGTVDGSGQGAPTRRRLLKYPKYLHPPMSIRGFVVSIRRYSGSLEGWLGGAGSGLLKAKICVAAKDLSLNYHIVDIS